VGISNRIQARLPLRLTEHVYLSVLAQLTHLQGSAYHRRDYVTVNLQLVGAELVFRILRLPGRAMMEDPRPTRGWERQGAYGE
jgi:hypothetical protein